MHQNPATMEASAPAGPPPARSQSALDYARVARALRYVIDNFGDRPSLDDIAGAAALSPFHFQRMFTRWAGVSPKRFLGYLTLDRARGALDRGASVLEAAAEAGLSAPSRLHDLFVTFDAVTPGEHRTGGEGLEILWGAHEGPFGDFVVAATGRGICGLEFFDGEGPGPALARVSGRFPAARLRRAPDRTAGLCGPMFDDAGPRRPLRVWCRGTNFQIRVWSALLALPPGALATYGTVADAVGAPSAARAVGNAVAANPVAMLIPCHRVIRASGLFGSGYRWGPERKFAFVGRELARTPASAPRPAAG